MRTIQQIACFVLLISTAACAHRPSEPLALPSPNTDASAVDVTTRCKALTEKGAEPHDAPGKNVYLSRREWKALASVRGKRLDDTAECIETVHDNYAEGLPR